MLVGEMTFESGYFLPLSILPSYREDEANFCMCIILLWRNPNIVCVPRSLPLERKEDCVARIFLNWLNFNRSYIFYIT